MNGTTPLKFEEPRIGTPGPSSHIRISRIIGTSRLSDQQKARWLTTAITVRFHARLPKAATNTTIASTIYF
jgi:hypothetical protein